MLSTIFDRTKKHLENELPFVLYSKPGERVLNAVFQMDDAVHKVSDYTEQGFVFAPFLENETAILLKAEKVHKVPLNVAPGTTVFSNNDTQSDLKEQSRYLALVEKAISEIKDGHFKKVVLSRFLEVKVSKPVLIMFQELLDTYPNAFCYLWYHPKIGMWLGATPEILIKSKGLGFTTMALAGTQNQLGLQECPSWSKKELEEQQLVTDYIEEVLKNRAREVQVANVETIKAGHLWHLRTKITGTFSKGAFKDLLTALHPTPAVCGLSLPDAMRFILQNEQYERRFYTGFLGELNLREERQRNKNRRNQENSAYRSVARGSELFVNLRCAQLVKDKAIVYVGGGITADSNARKEWLETQSKAQTMLRILST